TTNLSDRGLIRNAAYNTWADHRKYLSCWTPDVRVYSPLVETGDCSTVAISLDFRPADGTIGGADPNGGGYIGLYGTTTEGGPNDRGITLIRFDSTGVDTGNIVASTGGSDNFVTLGTWTYVDSNTNYHFDILVDNVNRMTTISIDGGEPVTLNWGGSFGTAMSSGTFNQIWFRGGLNATNNMTAVDNLLIEEGPAVAAAPTFTPDEMFITGPTEVTISSVTQNAVIYYTLDGSTPTKNSPTYGSSPLTVTVNGGDTLSAIAVADGFDNSPVSRQGFRTRTIPIVAWIGMPSNQLTLERFLELREAGFTHQLSQYYASFDYARWALDKAREAGIKFIPPVIPSYTAWCVEQIKDHPALEAYYVDDEPNASEFSSVAQTAATIQTLDPNHWCYINLFSNYADLSWGVSTYQDYVDNFLNTVSVPVLSFDHYPITSTGINPLFYENLEVISTAAKQKGIPFWAFALSSPHYDYSMPTLAHLRFQMFSNLAYGAQGLQYFTYWMCIADSISGPMDLDGNRTPIWYIVQEMNAEIVGLSPVFFGAEVMSVGHTGSLPSGTTAYTNSAPINSLTTSGSDGAVVSRLTNGDNDYLVVVNRDIVSTMTLNIGLDTSKTFTRVSKGGSETAISGGTVSYTVDPADIVILKWSNVTPRIPGDANGDGVVNVGDLGILAANYGRDLQAQGVPQAQWWGLGDFNNDGVVNVGDLGILAANYGSSGSSFQADYAKVFGTMSDDASTDDDDDIAGSLCGGLGLPLVAGLALMGLMLIKLDE
ncbi:MAG: hypothetical protein GX629_04855, partial [Phycisphaerae bacterium]|nr:hypothetical protein [Phycisphaerae bacterium]